MRQLFIIWCDFFSIVFFFQVCVTELDISTYEHSIVLEVIYSLGYMVMGLIINVAGKLTILSTHVTKTS